MTDLLQSFELQSLRSIVPSTKHELPTFVAQNCGSPWVPELLEAGADCVVPCKYPFYGVGMLASCPELLWRGRRSFFQPGFGEDFWL